MKQYQSKAPIRPFDVILEMANGAGGAQVLSQELTTVEPKPASGSLTQREQPEDLDDAGRVSFSCLRLDATLERWIFESNRSPGQREGYIVSFGSCDNPTCDCGAMEAWLQPMNPSDRSGIAHLRLMFETQEVQCNDPERPRDRQLAAELGARFTPEDWVRARRIYESEKADLSEPADASKLKISFPEDVRTDPTVLMRYQDVFPFARCSHFEIAGKFFVIFERYCSNPDCTCTEVYLDVAASPPPVRGLKHAGPPHVIKDKDVTRIVFDYETGKNTVRKKGSPDLPPAQELLHALHEADPGLKLRVKRRHHVLRQLHLQARRSPARLGIPQPIRRDRKVGRNEPCPCGSGKKFKQCCGR